MLVAVGRRPASAGLGLEHTRASADARGFVTVNDRCRTADPAIYAVGDVTGEPMLAHRAMRQGKVAAEVIAGRPAAFDNVVVPAVVFTDPEVAWCGLTESDAAREGRTVKIAKREWAASGRALTLGRSDGLTKILADPDTGRVLGVGIVGPGAGELIALLLAAGDEAGDLVGDLDGGRRVLAAAGSLSLPIAAPRRRSSRPRAVRRRAASPHAENRRGAARGSVPGSRSAPAPGAS